MSVFNEKDIVIHNGKVGIITHVNSDNEEVNVKFDGGIEILLPYDCVCVVDSQSGELDNDCDYWLFTKNCMGMEYFVHFRKTTVSIFDLTSHRTGNVGDKIYKNNQEIYTITPQDIVFMEMVEFFEGNFFSYENFADIEEVCNWISCVENFVDVEIVWKRSTSQSQPTNSYTVDEEDLRETYYQACTEKRNNFWRE